MPLLSSAFLVNGTPSGGQTQPDLAALAGALPDGRLCVVWIKPDASFSATGRVRARLFEADGQAAGAAFDLSHNLHGDNAPRIAATADGRFFIGGTGQNPLGTAVGDASGVVAIYGRFIDPRAESVVWTGTAMAEQFTSADFNDTRDGGAGHDSAGGGHGNDQISGGSGNDTLNGDFGYDRLNGGSEADTFCHPGVADHGSGWVQDCRAAGLDLLRAGIAGATRAQFQGTFAETAGAGTAGVAEAFMIYRPTGQILWALVDGAAEGQILLA